MPAPARPRDFALLFLLASIWGGSYMLIKLALVDVPPISVAAARIVLAAAVLVGVVVARGDRLPPAHPRAWAPFVVLALLGNVIPFSLISWGEVRIASGLTAILLGCVPFATMTLAHFLTDDDPFTPNKGWGLAFGFAGLVVLVGPSAIAGLGGELAAQLAIVGAGLCYANATVFARRLRRNPATVTAASTLICASAIIAPISLALDQPWRLAPSPTALGALALLGVVGTAGASLIFFRLVNTAGASFTALINYLIPLMGVMWGATVLGERPSTEAYVALALILTGIAAINRRRRSKEPPTPSRQPSAKPDP